jgi:hypothetical protein
MLNTFKNSQDLYKHRPWLTFWVLVTLGTMVLVVCSLLLGCGSDSTPRGSVKEKNTKTAPTHGAKKLQVPNLLGMGEERALRAGEMVNIKKQPDRKTLEPPYITQEEMDAKNAAAVKIAESPGREIMPGITREEMDKRNAAAQKTGPPRFMERMAQGSKQADAQPPAKPHIPPSTGK